MPLQQTAPQDPTGTGPYNSSTPVASCTLSSFTGTRVWLATFTINYSAVPANVFAKHITAAGDVVILKCADITHVWLLGAGGTTDTIY
jgi:hypothetical protein